MTTAGIIFSNIHDSGIPEFTKMRTMASVPFGCRYRLIDIPLSNMVNSGISSIGIITHNNYSSLVDHIGHGKDWDLARRSGGIKILSPFISMSEGVAGGCNSLYNSRAEALDGIKNYLSRCTEESVLLCDCDSVCNIDIRGVLKYHEQNGAKITTVSVDKSFLDWEITKDLYEISSDNDGNVTSFAKLGGRCAATSICTNIMVFDRIFLIDSIDEAMNGRNNGDVDFYGDVISKSIGHTIVKNYRYEGRFMLISSLRTYFSASMELLDSKVRDELFGNPQRPIYTKVRNTAPTLYTESSAVRSSYVADGCIIEGDVENSILFRGVKIGKGSVVKNSILLQDTCIEGDVSLNCVVTDKNVTIHSGRTLSGHESLPFFLPKGRKV